MVQPSGHWVWHMCCKYWILVCAAMFLVISIQEAVIYRIIYMVLFLYFVISFQVSASYFTACRAPAVSGHRLRDGCEL